MRPTPDRAVGLSLPHETDGGRALRAAHASPSSTTAAAPTCFFELVDPIRPGDREDIVTLSQHPGERDMGRPKSRALTARTASTMALTHPFSMSSPPASASRYAASRRPWVVSLERRGWDLNPRGLASQGFSRASHSAALPPLRAGTGGYRFSVGSGREAPTSIRRPPARRLPRRGGGRGRARRRPDRSRGT